MDHLFRQSMRWSIVLTLLFSATNVSAQNGVRRAPEKTEGHWGEGKLGFRWVEDDSIDDRWNQMEIGPCLASSLVTPTGLITKNLSVQLDATRQVHACFDTRRLLWRCGWRGQFLRFTPARFGVVAPPEIAGTIDFNVPDVAHSWGANARYLGHYLDGSRVIIAYVGDGVKFLDSLSFSLWHDHPIYVRTMQIDAADKALELVVAPHSGGFATQANSSSISWQRASEGDAPIRLSVPARKATVTFELAWSPSLHDDELSRWLHESRKPIDLTESIQQGAPRWPDTMATVGQRGADDHAYAVDTLTLPFDNRYRALLFVSGHDFFSQPGRAAISTMHGDVWIVDGIDDQLTSLRWRRFATGLYQPLGLRIVDDKIYVLGRDRVTRLHDTNHDGEADFYESFNDEAITSAGGHDFSTCLETDVDGNFYYVSEAGVHRIRADGAHYETIATGLRNPNGLSANNQHTLTVAPQEGQWTPASAVYEVTPKAHYGYGGPRITPERPRGYDPPLFYLPRRIDNSTGGQVWIDSDRWGPLTGGLLTLSLGQCRLLYCPLEPRTLTIPSHWPLQPSTNVLQVADTDPRIARDAQWRQGGAITLPLAFASGIQRGRFSPWDRQLYVTGMRGWVSAAAQDGCFQRVRYTNQPLRIVSQVRTLGNGIALTFTTPLQREAAEDPDNYAVEQWNYRYSSEYGSADYRIHDPTQEGHDVVSVKSATMLDERSVFLEFDRCEPAMQLAISYVLTASDETIFRDVYYHTIHIVPPERLDFTRRARGIAPPRANRVTADSLQSGLLWRFTSLPARRSEIESPQQNPASPIETRRRRLAALHVPLGQPPADRLPAGPFRARAEGYLQLALRDHLTFSVQGAGTVQLRINDEIVLHGESHDLSQLARRTIPVHKGLNRIDIDYRPLPEHDATLRVHWRGADFDEEPIPPTVLVCDSNDPSLSLWERWSRGRDLFTSGRCGRCHAPTNSSATTSPWPPGDDAPDLSMIGQRWTRETIAEWILHPRATRPHGEMPAYFDGQRTEDWQAAYDIATFLAEASLGNEAVKGTERPTDDDDSESSVRGKELYESWQCVACHRLTSEATEAHDDRVALVSLAGKYRPGQLIEFLLDPHRHFAQRKMPNFLMQPSQARDLGAYLEQASQQEKSSTSPRRAGDRDRGQRLVEQLGCRACHRVAENHQVAVVPTAITQWSDAAGCLGGVRQRMRGPTSRGPRFQLSPKDIDAIQTFVSDAPMSLGQPRTAVDEALRMATTWRCLACHDQDGVSSSRAEWSAFDGSGQLLEVFPDLTWTGEKLHTAWTEAFLQRSTASTVRPWLKARMPAFPRAASVVLAEGMSHAHGIAALSSPPIATSAADTKFIGLGEQLTRKTGLDCRQCHGVGDEQPTGDERTQLARGINFVDVATRVRYDYYRRFVLDPPRVDPRTKMPKLAADGRRTPIVSILDGDAIAQFDAIWTFIQTLRPAPLSTSPPPSGISP